jgi:hypothetical protein
MATFECEEKTMEDTLIKGKLDAVDEVALLLNLRQKTISLQE